MYMYMYMYIYNIAKQTLISCNQHPPSLSIIDLVMAWGPSLMASKSVSGTPWSKPAWPWLRGGSVDPMEIEKSGENRLAQLRTRHLGKALEQPWWPVHKPRQRFVVKLLNSIPTHPYIIIPILLMISPTISWVCSRWPHTMNISSL